MFRLHCKRQKKFHWTQLQVALKMMFNKFLVGLLNLLKKERKLKAKKRRKSLSLFNAKQSAWLIQLFEDKRSCYKNRIRLIIGKECRKLLEHNIGLLVQGKRLHLLNQELMDSHKTHNKISNLAVLRLLKQLAANKVYCLYVKMLKKNLLTKLITITQRGLERL